MPKASKVNVKVLLVALVITTGIVSMPIADAILWDLIISAEVQNQPIQTHDDLFLKGIVIDHAGKPVENVQLEVRLEGSTIYLQTNSTGNFEHVFEGLELIPGEYLINIKGQLEEKKGINTVIFKIDGDVSLSSHTAKLLETPHAIRYLNSSPEDFENDPLGLSLYYYYQELKEKFIEQEKMQDEIYENIEYLDEQREIADNVTEMVIEEQNPGAGTYSGWKKDRFVDALDMSIKDIIIGQLNYTIDAFEQAQKAMSDVLENGGTMEEARQAYYEKAAITQDMMNALTVIPSDQELNNNENSTTSLNNATSEDSPVESNMQEEGEDNTVNIKVNGTDIQVGTSGTTIFLNVNGTVIEFIVNGTEIVPVSNSTAN